MKFIDYCIGALGGALMGGVFVMLGCVLTFAYPNSWWSITLATIVVMFCVLMGIKITHEGITTREECDKHMYIPPTPYHILKNDEEYDIILDDKDYEVIDDELERHRKTFGHTHFINPW